jgi:hypothetical protein
MMPWKHREHAAAEAAQKARLDYEETRAQRPLVEAIARHINREGRKNGWMEDLEKIMETGS